VSSRTSQRIRESNPQHPLRNKPPHAHVEPLEKRQNGGGEIWGHSRKKSFGDNLGTSFFMLMEKVVNLGTFVAKFGLAQPASLASDVKAVNNLGHRL
jgi:hypothetical protein